MHNSSPVVKKGLEPHNLSSACTKKVVLYGEYFIFLAHCEF